jgi:hypothetical protein
MLVLRSGVLLLALRHFPGRVDAGSLATRSGALFDIAVSVALVELALAVVVALVCGVMLLLAGVVTTADLSGIAQKLRPSRAVLRADSDDISLAALETMVGLRKSRRT